MPSEAPVGGKKRCSARRTAARRAAEGGVWRVIDSDMGGFVAENPLGVMLFSGPPVERLGFDFADALYYELFR